MCNHASHINHIIHTITPIHYTTVTPITTPLKSTRIEEIVQEWYADFVDVDQIMLFELVTAANFMDIKALLDLTCLAVSVLIKVSDFNRLGI
jgi:S-phase kinase-associated protein 1